MRLIYDGGSNEVITVDNIVFRGGRVSGEIDAARGARIVAAKHLKIREATAAEVAAADGTLPPVVEKAMKKAKKATDDFAAKLDDDKETKA